MGIILNFSYLRQLNDFEVKKNITNDKANEGVSHLEITEVVLVYSNVVNYDFQQHSRILYTFTSNK